MNRLSQLSKIIGLDLSPEIIAKFQDYFELLIHYNSLLNLTSIVSKEEVMVKHFYDSLTIGLASIEIENKRIIDVGTGAGFPGIPIALAWDGVSVDLVETLGKRVDFLKEVKRKLNLTNVSCYKDRAEDFGRNADFRENYDIALSRAVASLPVLLEYLLPLVKVGGVALCYKGSNINDELRDADTAISILGGGEVKVIDFSLPDGMGDRSLVLVKKIAHTGLSYPRRAGIPAKKPLK